jgi:hypothetical protein
MDPQSAQRACHRAVAFAIPRVNTAGYKGDRRNGLGGVIACVGQSSRDAPARRAPPSSPTQSLAVSPSVS